jgi:hypothetical protein
MSSALSEVFVLFGQTGEYSDRQEWLVAAYATEAAAQAAVEHHEAWLRERGLSSCDGDISYDGRRDLVKPDWDPHLSVDYTGTRYYYARAPMAAE